MSRDGLHMERAEGRNRRSSRLKGYDYAGAGAYFVTICAQNRECLFGEIVDGKMLLNDAGRMVETVWDQLPIRFPHLELDEFIVMPNHIHGILVSHRTQTGDHKDRPYMAPDTVGYRKSGEQKVRPDGRPHGTLPGTVGRVVQAFKSITTHEYVHGVKQYGWRRFNGKLWQRNYYEHVIRNDNELNRIREYIATNPARWKTDQENPDATDRRGEPCVRPIDVRPNRVRPIDDRPTPVRRRACRPPGTDPWKGRR